MDAFGAKIRDVSTDEALRIRRCGSCVVGLLGLLGFGADKGLLGPARDIERLKVFPTSISLSSIGLLCATAVVARLEGSGVDVNCD